MALSSGLKFYAKMDFRKKIAVFASATVVIVSACSVMREESAPSNRGMTPSRNVVESPYTKGNVQEDSLKQVIAYQSDKRMMLVNQIKSSDGVFYLNLSEEDVAELNIPDSLYRWALNFVESLNAE